MKLNRIRLFLSALTVFSLGVFVSCEDDSSTENQLNGGYVSLAEKPETIVVDEGETVTVESKVFASRASNVDRVINLQVIFESAYNTAHPDEEGNPGTTVPVTTIGEDDFTVPATVTIPAGAVEATFSIDITDVNLGYNGKRIVVAIVPKPELEVATSTIGTVSAGDYEILTKRLIVTALRRCAENSFRIEIVTDNYGSETTWELYDADFNIIGVGGPYPDGAPVSAEIRSFCLAAGTYTFAVYDSEGDGMFDSTNQGYYRLFTVDAAGVETNIHQNGTFGEFETYEFTLD